MAAAEHTAEHAVSASTTAFSISADGRCGTCQFWGGRRRVSDDGKAVLAESLGTCNNPPSHNFRKVTTPETGPMPLWKKWEALTAGA